MTTDDVPAFPSEKPFGGMTMRDWFAGMALSGMVATKRFVEHDPRTVMGDFTDWAYGFADAMIEARKK